MVSISNSTLRQNVYETLYDLLKAQEGSYGASSAVTVTAAYIDDENAFPQVIVNPVNVDKSDFTFDRTADNSMKSVKAVVDVYTKKAKDLDIIADVVDNTLSTSSINGVTLIESSESNAVSNISEVKVHNKTLSYSFVRR